MYDHCHITGKYRVPAHQVCNLNYKIDPTRWKIPVVIHNLRGYDSHLIIQALEEKHGSINIIPSNMEKYISFSIDRLTLRSIMLEALINTKLLIILHPTKAFESKTNTKSLLVPLLTMIQLLVEIA